MSHTEYLKEWRANNVEHVQEYTRKYSKKWREENPDKEREYKRKWYEANKAHVIAKSKVNAEARKEANPSKFKEDNNRRERTRRRKQREGNATHPMPAVCEICGCPPSGKGDAGSTLHWDHDHISEKFRGWLCHRCNLTLGQVKDSPELLGKMISYLIG